MHSAPRSLLPALLAAAVLWGAPALAQARTLPGIQEVDVIESLGEQLPLDARFTDENGQEVRLSDLVRGDKPLVLVLAYYNCPTLCNLVLGGMSKAVRESGMLLGQDFRAITLSIDPREKPSLARERQRGHLQSLGVDGHEKDWTFLTGTEEQIRRVADRVGFRYKYDEKSGQYAHAAVIVVLTPEGKLSRYLYGVKFPARDLKFSLIEAAGGRVGTSFDRAILTCFKYDPNTRRYDFFMYGFLRTGGLIVFGALAVTLGIFWRREFKRGTIK